MRAGADVVVAGLGALGAAAAGALARRGLSVVGLDRHRPPHDLGSTHGGTRIRLRRRFPLLRPPIELEPHLSARLIGG